MENHDMEGGEDECYEAGRCSRDLAESIAWFLSRPGRSVVGVQPAVKVLCPWSLVRNVNWQLANALHYTTIHQCSATTRKLFVSIQAGTKSVCSRKSESQKGASTPIRG